MNTEIVFERARIAAVEHRISAAGVSSRIKVVAIATSKIAKAIGARWLLDRDQLVKQGFTSVELDYAMKNVRAKHSIDKVATLEVISDLVTKFKVFRKGDDNKKSKRLMASFQVHHSGSPFELLEHLMKVGEGEGTFTLEPLQSELFPAGNGKPEAKAAKKNGHGAQQMLPKPMSKKAARDAARTDEALQQRSGKEAAYKD